MMRSAENQLDPRSNGISSPPAPREAVWRRPSPENIFRHGWWLFGLVLILVGALSLLLYLRGPRSYQTEQSFYVLVSPAGAATSYENYQAGVWEETIGHALAEGRLTTVDGGFAGAIDAELAGDRVAGGPQNLTSSQFQRYLSWSNSGNMVVLTADWTTPTGSQALLGATAAAVEEGDLAQVTVWRGALPPEFSARIVPASSATSPVLDQSQQTANKQLMLSRIALGVAGGLLLALVWDWVQRLRRRSSSASLPAQAAMR